MTSSFLTAKSAFFDRWAPHYDCLLTTIFYQAVHQRLLDHVQLPERPQVLDLGCGTGKLLNRLGDRFPDLRGTGLDLSAEMIQQARQKNRHRPRLIFIQGSSDRMPLLDASCDAVFNTISFLHYPNPEGVMQEVARVLKPGGCFYLADYTVPRSPAPKVVPFSPGGLRFYSAPTREALATQAGLRCVGHYPLVGAVLLSIFQRYG